MNDTPVSKVLVLDDDPEHAPLIKRFCDEHHLVAHKVRKGSEISVLRTNIDLGGILFSEAYGGSREDAFRLALRIREVRPELPIMIRREAQATLEGLEDGMSHVFCGAYVAGDIGALARLVEEYIFCLKYPNAMVRGITEIIQSVLVDEFKALSVVSNAPYIVQDRVIFGELFSLIQLESTWCRGYMMLQSEEDPFLDLSATDGIFGSASLIRSVNARLGDITNRIWGEFKNRFVGDQQTSPAALIQVPQIVNHKHRYISFGSENPQLCFRFQLTEPRSRHAWDLFARFIFNLNWSPESFREVSRDIENLVDAGELDVF